MALVPRFPRLTGAATVLATLLLPAATLAQRHPSPPESETTTTTTTVPAPEHHTPGALPPDATTEATVTVASGKTIPYTAVAGLLPVGSSDPQDAMLAPDGRYLPTAGIDLPAKPEDQPATAAMFYTAYFAKGPNGGQDPITRPITFFYNGGPGSATMYLRMTSLGPVRVQLPDLTHPVGGPYRIAPNPQTLLDATDIVFIDAPGTGYSRIHGKDASKAFYGVDQDAAAFDRFIRRFLTKFNRWSSPKYLFGESYGTTRDAVLGAKLQQHSVDLNGIVFLSQILSFSDSADGSDGDPGNEKSFFLALPSFAATAWYHHKLASQPAQLEPFLHEVEQFALTDYAAALLQGADLDAAKKQSIAAKLESYTGIPSTLWLKANLRLTGEEFSKYLQDPADITTGRLDSRYQGPSMDPLSKDADYDPFTDSVDSAIASTMNTYAHETLHFGQDMTYKPGINDATGERWDLHHRPPSRNGGGWAGTFTNVMPDLAYTLTVNSHMHVLLMGGYFDLGTLYFGAVYEMKHLPIRPELQPHIEYKFFPTGHMVYLNEQALKDLHDRTAAFIQSSQTGQ